jgi:bacteriocin biosynthesis cyclodehydratase domain-containing protein
MSLFPLRRPLLPSHYRVLLEPPDDRGDESILFVSDARRVKLKGHSFREFERAVIPLLDGGHTLADIGAATAELFAPADLEDALRLLLANGLLREGDSGDGQVDGGMRAPQWNLLHDLGLDPAAAQSILAGSTVAVFGLAGAGAVATQALAAAGVGTLRLVETEDVRATDPYLAPVYTNADIGRPRAEVLGERLAAIAAEASIELAAAPLPDEEAVRKVIGGASIVLCCLDGGRSSLIYKLNRVCVNQLQPWLAVSTAGTEVLVGPLMCPPETACYLCYCMRLVAAAQNPEDEYALKSLLDRRKRDDTPTHENLVFGEGIAGQLAALEVVKVLCGLPSAMEGQLQVFDLLALSSHRHRVLRKPWCPVCHATCKSGTAEHTVDTGAA